MVSFTDGAGGYALMFIGFAVLAGQNWQWRPCGLLELRVAFLLIALTFAVFAFANIEGWNR